MFDLFESMLTGSKVEAHGKTWWRIKELRNDLEQGITLYLACELGASLPAECRVIGETIEPERLAKLREAEAKHQAELAAMRKKP